MFKNILKLVVVFVLGIAGGIFADKFLWPYLEHAPVYVTEKNEITIQENVALQQAVEKVEKAIVGVRTKTKEGKILTGSGVVVTSDGLMITLAELLPQGESFVFFVDGKTPQYQVLKRDLKNNLVLVKIEEQNLPTIGFADFGRLKLGERVFLVGMILGKDGSYKVVNEGIVKFFDDDHIQTNILEKNNLAGSPLFNIQGELLGLNTINSEGNVIAIPVTKLRQFVGF